jgi:hypothetical protein
VERNEDLAGPGMPLRIRPDEQRRATDGRQEGPTPVCNPAVLEQYPTYPTYPTSPHSSYGPVQTINYYAQPDPQDASSSLYASASSPAYYGTTESSSSAARGPSYDARYYAPTYGDYTAQGGWFPDGPGTTYAMPNDFSLDGSRRTADPFQFCDPEL